MANAKKSLPQCQKPSGWIGRLIVWNMNSRHSTVTDWGLSHASINKTDRILDVGCGGGRTIGKLAAMASEGKVYGVDYSAVSVSIARKVNAASIAQGRVGICKGSVSELPFQASRFDLVTAVETHFWWPDVLAGLREIERILKQGGTFVLIAEIYKGAQTRMAKLVEQMASRSGIKVFTPEEHHQLLADAGFTGIQISKEESKGWICAIGRKVPAR